MKRWGGAGHKTAEAHLREPPCESVARAEISQPPPGGYREVLRIAVPLIVSTASLTVTLFVDRMFLSWYSLSAVAAAVPGGITYFTICSFFLGTAQYVNTLVAQHHGSNDKPACARAVWQGVWFSLLSFPCILAAIPLGEALLARSGHGPEVVRLETEYFSILMLGGAALPFNAALASFFSGRGKTRVVMWGNILGNSANVLLDYLLIFGHAGFPEMGIRGAAIATAITGVIPPVFWACLFLSRKYQPLYQTRRQMCRDRRLFLLLLRYGVPSGVQFFLDVASFTLFIILIGRLGEADLAATNIVVSIQMLSFLPMVGMSIATATLVGEYIGRSDLRIAEKSVYSSLKLALLYSGTLAALYFVVPEIFVALFRNRIEDVAGFAVVAEKGALILRLIAVFTVFDTIFIVFSGALKGAGDTRFAMWAQIVAAWIFFVPPVYFIVEVFHMGLLTAWCWGVVYIVGLGTVFWGRFRSGRWKAIRMVEESGLRA
ncbi:MAG: MATE family efflux transporter [Desulfomonilaceae bacterium]|nr:MATE family efflux transporter [Desulfomonilaceae bacterium]